jgi:Transglycosylase-like domain
MVPALPPPETVAVDLWPPVELQAVVIDLPLLPPLAHVAGETVVIGPLFDELMCLNRHEHAGVWHNEDGRDRTFRGGLQFLPSTWRAMGGWGDPAAASVQEQLDRGAALAEQSGWGQWPVAARRCGLR